MKTHSPSVAKSRHDAELNQVADNSRALLDATAEATDDTVVEARSRLKSALDAAGQACARVKDKAIDGAKATDQTIRENPYQALAISLGIGLIAGLWLGRRNQD